VSDNHRSMSESLSMEAVYRALRALAPERADALVLRIFGGLSTAEAAQVMGVSETMIKSLVCQGVRDLRETLVKRDEAEP
jgi:RNA polymerase sigma-70 factor (ECF subfamily)